MGKKKKNQVDSELCGVIAEVYGTFSNGLAEISKSVDDDLLLSELSQIDANLDECDRILSTLVNEFYGFDADLIGVYEPLTKKGYAVKEVTKMAKFIEKLVKDYVGIIKTAKETDGSLRDIDAVEFINALVALDKEKLEAISKLEKPILLFIPGNTIENKLANLNANRPFSLDGEKFVEYHDYSKGSLSVRAKDAHEDQLIVIDVGSKASEDKTEMAEVKKAIKEITDSRYKSLIDADQLLVLCHYLMKNSEKFHKEIDEIINEIGQILLAPRTDIPLEALEYETAQISSTFVFLGGLTVLGRIEDPKLKIIPMIEVMKMPPKLIK